jgi:hypothetical protein
MNTRVYANSCLIEKFDDGFVVLPSELLPFAWYAHVNLCLAYGHARRNETYVGKTLVHHLPTIVRAG